jgi:hypothetical protein
MRTRHRVASRLAPDLSKLPAEIARYFITTRNKEGRSMMDVIVLGFALGLFALAIGYAHACDRLL